MIQKEKEIDILLFALQERYNSIHTIRDRIQSISLWLLWIILWVSWWIVQKNISFYCNEKTIVIILTICLALIFYWYFEDLKKWVNKQREITAKIEENLWFFDWDESIYPKKWKDKCEDRPFLNSHYKLLWFWFFVLIISILYFT